MVKCLSFEAFFPQRCLISLCVPPVLFHLSFHLCLYYPMYRSLPRNIYLPLPFAFIPLPPSSCSPPPAPPRLNPRSHLICLQSVWLIYHCSEILKSLLPLVLRGVHHFYLQHMHVQTHTHNLNRSVFQRRAPCYTSFLLHLSFQSLLSALRDWLHMASWQILLLWDPLGTCMLSERLLAFVLESLSDSGTYACSWTPISMSWSCHARESWLMWTSVVAAGGFMETTVYVQGLEKARLLSVTDVIRKK